MSEEKMLSLEEAYATLEIVMEYLRQGACDLAFAKRVACGRLLSEVLFTIESYQGPTNVVHLTPRRLDEQED